MKVLFDCILTAEPRKCSTTVQFITLANMLVEAGVFVYWPIPDRLTEEECLQYPQHPNIKYMPIPQSKDRVREYGRVSNELEKVLAFNGSTWDWDVLVTVRTPQVPAMKVLSLSPRQARTNWTKRVVLIEDMLVLTSKVTVPKSAPEIQNRMTIEGMLAADEVIMPAYHEKALVMEEARKHFSPARMKDLMAKIQEVCHLNVPDWGLKTEFKYSGGRKMNVAFVGRLERVAANLDTLNDVLTKQWVLNSENVHPFVCTVSEGRKVLDTTAVEVLHPTRAEFWKICRERMDLAVYFQVEVMQLMSILEPLAMGVPIILYKGLGYDSLVGEQYPFLVKDRVEAYAFISKFSADYQGMYSLFAKWWSEWFQPTYSKRVSEGGMYTRLMAAVQKDVTDHEWVKGKLGNEILKLLVEHGGEEFVLFDLIKKLDDLGLLSGLAAKLREDDREYRSLVFSTPWNEFRVLLKGLGYEDASTVVGHLKKGA